MTCQHHEGCHRPIENRDTGLCASHNKEARKPVKEQKPRKALKPKSDKRKNLDKIYSEIRRIHLEQHPNCGVCGLPASDSIHHMRGREGYADDYARENDIPLLIDDRFFLSIHSYNIHPRFGVSCHRWVEDHPEQAKQMEFSYKRT